MKLRSAADDVDAERFVDGLRQARDLEIAAAAHDGRALSAGRSLPPARSGRGRPVRAGHERPSSPGSRFRPPPAGRTLQRRGLKLRGDPRVKDPPRASAPRPPAVAWQR